MPRRHKTERWLLLARAAREVGCPFRQIVNFHRGLYVPQPQQLRFHAACREADLACGPVQIGFGGARGPGKSHAMLAQLALDDCQRRPGLKCLLLRKVGKAVRESFEDLRTRVLCRSHNEWRRGEGMLVFPNESRILLGHFKDESDIDAYLGLEYDVIGVEEATTLTAAKYKAITTCNRTSKPGWRPRLYSTTNPGGVGHTWYKELFIKPYQLGRETATRFIPATIDDNYFINPEYRARLEGLTGWLKRAWRFGDWDIAAGQFFTTWRADAHTCPPLPAILPNWRVWLAMDYGFTHYTVIHLLAQDGDGHVYVLDEHAAQRWLIPRHAAAVRIMLARWQIEPARLACFVAGRDCFAARPTIEGTIADQWAAEGFSLDVANDDRISGAAEILRRLGDVDAGLAPSLSISTRCHRLVEAMPILQHDPGRPEDVLKVDVDDDGGGGDDAYDAFRYGLMVAARSDADLLFAAAQLAARLTAWRG